MTHLCTMLAGFSAILLPLIFPLDAFTATNDQAKIPRIDLAVSFDIGNQLVRGTSRIEIAAGESLHLYLPDLTVTGALLSTPSRENRVIDVNQRDGISIQPADESRTLLISYEKTIERSFDNLLSPEAIVLTSGWHPVPDKRALFSLTAHAPDGFTVLSQADHFAPNSSDSSGGGPVHHSFSQPLRAMTLVAAPYEVESREVRDGLNVYSLFFEADRELAADYLDAAVGFIRRYEALIGEFPYNHYVIAENVMPTGYGFPTFTLLGQQVIRLPFIKQTSLGHEILHSWFGNAVDIADGSGNWCEGLTTYLADMAYREDAGEGADARKEALLTFHSYVDDDTAPLATFRSAGHERAASRGVRAVGYQKSALLFHELRHRIGDDAFNRGLRRLYREHRGDSASWDDIEALFTSESGEKLHTFFFQRLRDNMSPELVINDISVSRDGGKTMLAVTVSQVQEGPHELLLPVSIETITGVTRHRRLISGAQETITIDVDATPLAVTLDADYDLLRTLSAAEDRPVWSKLLGSPTLVVIPSDPNEAELFTPLLELVSRYGWETVDADQLSQEAVETNSQLFLAINEPRVAMMFGSSNHPAEGFTLDMRVNPFNEDEVVGLVSSSSVQETRAVVHRLPHYGKYSYLHFLQGRATVREMAESVNGIRVQIETAISGVALDDLDPLEKLIDALERKRVVYIGETHTSRADHLLQLLLIEALHQRDGDLAIGLEMFPRSSQPALDRYINDDTFSEANFLKASGYFSVWGYDYRLFRPIFNFARTHRIPLVGLNVDREIVSAVFKGGSLDVLSDEQREALPAEMRLDLPGYIERLRATHHMHHSAAQAGGGFTGFIQSQGIWDETMAESITGFLQSNPDTAMVVLAGSQHTRKDSGIPPRVARRMNVDQASVLNGATNGPTPAELSRTADYLFFLDSPDFTPAGKIGIVLEESTDDTGKRMRITGISPHSNAETSGLRTDDLLIFIDEFTIHTMVDVKLALLEKTAGDLVTIGVSRRTGDDVEELSLPVELYRPAPMKNHP